MGTQLAQSVMSLWHRHSASCLDSFVCSVRRGVALTSVRAGRVSWPAVGTSPTAAGLTSSATHAAAPLCIISWGFGSHRSGGGGRACMLLRPGQAPQVAVNEAATQRTALGSAAYVAVLSVIRGSLCITYGAAMSVSVALPCPAIDPCSMKWCSTWDAGAGTVHQLALPKLQNSLTCSGRRPDLN
jgi:hypothetical protein